MLCIPHQYHSDDQLKKTEMGRACSTYGEVKRCIQGCNGETLWKDLTWKTQV
jgi:hypothetical protein